MRPLALLLPLTTIFAPTTLAASGPSSKSPPFLHPNDIVGSAFGGPSNQLPPYLHPNDIAMDTSPGTGWGGPCHPYTALEHCYPRVEIQRFDTTSCDAGTQTAGKPIALRRNYCHTFPEHQARMQGLRAKVVTDALGRPRGEKRFAVFRNNWCYVFAYEGADCLGEVMRMTELSDSQGLCEATPMFARSVMVKCQPKLGHDRLPAAKPGLV